MLEYPPLTMEIAAIFGPTPPVTPHLVFLNVFIHLTSMGIFTGDPLEYSVSINLLNLFSVHTLTMSVITSAYLKAQWYRVVLVNIIHIIRRCTLLVLLIRWST